MIKCRVCLSVCEDFNESYVDTEYFLLLNMKNMGGVLKPLQNIIDVCNFVEKISSGPKNYQ